MQKTGSTAEPDQIRKNLVERWDHCVAIIDSMKASGALDEKNEQHMDSWRQYVEARREGAQFLYRWASEKDSTMLDSSKLYMQKAGVIMNVIDAQVKEDKGE